MKRADFQARIKRIEITNKATAEGWHQAIRVILDDIELTDENLLELRQFKPSQGVFITIEPAQPALFNPGGVEKGGVEQGDLGKGEIDSGYGGNGAVDSGGMAGFAEISEGDAPLQGRVDKYWDFTGGD